MAQAVLVKDSELRFPHLVLIKASAGSGKTHALAERFVQFLLSETIPHNHLRNLLAITFSNNAAKEMKERILSWLKEISFRDQEKLSQLSQVLSLDEEQMVKRAESLIEEIILNYTDFQVRTIDSFMTSIYKASAIDLGFNPDFDIEMSPHATMAYAFNRFLRRVRADSADAHLLEEILERIAEGRGAEARYLWDPWEGLLEEMIELYNKLSTMVKPIRIPRADTDPARITKEITRIAHELNTLIQQSSLARNKRSTFEKILDVIKNESYPDLIGMGLTNPPVTKPEDGERNPTYQHIVEVWSKLGTLIKEYTCHYAHNYYNPYVKAYETFREALEKTKNEEGIVFISDINKKLSQYLPHYIIPDIYFKIGETVYHYLIDEFQDTSPIQWENLRPLIENALAQGGSFFAVGDTKQAIYGFRDADYRIMRGLESKNPFPSAYHEVKELKINFRSLKRIVQFNEEFFQQVVTAHADYREAAERSGLADYVQEVRKGHEEGGYVEVKRCEENREEPIEKKELQHLIQELHQRGYRYSDIAILTQKNEKVVKFTTWLNEIDVPFISYSSLDIRRRKLTGEIFSLLTFLDSPRDNLSFAGFLLGTIFTKTLDRKGKQVTTEQLHDFTFRNRMSTYLYKMFQEEFPDLWEDFFDRLFRSTGYLPLYDLVNEIYRTFEVFEIFKEEEATLVKILEVINTFEKEGMNNPGDFLKRAFDEISEDTAWNIDVPEGIEAVKVMTIHKAKGLGFPVVILILYGEQTRPFKYLLDEGGEDIQLLKVTREITTASDGLKTIYEEERMKELVNRLNTLYVGFTRPESELYVMGVSGKKKQFPIDLLERAGYPPSKKGVPRRGSTTIQQSFLPPYHSTTSLDLSPPQVTEELNIEEKKRGKFTHRILSLLEYLDEDSSSRLRFLLDQLTREEPIEDQRDTLAENLLGFLCNEEVAPYFVPKPSRIIKREQEFSDGKGNLWRMDRVIIDKDRVTVMDFKTGREHRAEEHHRAQVKNYLRVLKEIYPEKHIEGIIAYTDSKKIVRIR